MAVAPQGVRLKLLGLWFWCPAFHARNLARMSRAERRRWAKRNRRLLRPVTTEEMGLR